MALLNRLKHLYAQMQLILGIIIGLLHQPNVEVAVTGYSGQRNNLVQGEVGFDYVRQRF
jgi:hypothetical protein